MKLKPGMVVHCDTREKAVRFLKECDKQGVTMGSLNPATRLDALNVWSQNKNDTCYRIHSRIHSEKLIVEFSKISYYLKNGFKVIEFDDLFKEKNKMSKCKIYEMPDYVRDEVKKVIINNRTVVVILKSGHKGVATCSLEDKFVESIGYQIALLRARIDKSKQDLKVKEETLNRITENPKLIAEFSIV